MAGCSRAYVSVSVWAFFTPSFGNHLWEQLGNLLSLSLSCPCWKVLHYHFPISENLVLTFFPLFYSIVCSKCFAVNNSPLCVARVHWCCSCTWVIKRDFFLTPVFYFCCRNCGHGWQAVHSRRSLHNSDTRYRKHSGCLQSWRHR